MKTIAGVVLLVIAGSTAALSLSVPFSLVGLALLITDR
jgi:hypothetical protein